MVDPTIQQELYLLSDEIEAKGMRLLFEAAEHGILELVNKQIARGIDVNSSDNNQKSPIDYAWENKFYDVVLLLLKADSKFPKHFNLVQLNDESAKGLQNFVGERKLLHRYIEEGNIQEVQKLVNKNKSKFYFNEKNQTAASVANKCRKWDILAFFLNSVGVEFFNEQEKREIDGLELQYKSALTGAMVPNFPPVSNPHIWYLVSKSKSQKPVENLEDKLQDFYIKLDEIPEISMILKMIQHSEYLDIVFDFDNENVNAVNLLSSKNSRGETNYKEGRLYIAASSKRGKKKILGTIAHEITHMAMQVLFENECNPYLKSDKKRKDEFEKMTRGILTRARNIENHPSQIIFNVAKSYEVRDYHSELIVTVPQILAEYENGREWLQSNVKELLDFFVNSIIPKCQEYVNKSPNLKIINTVKKLNETTGEIGKLKNSNILFINIDHIKNLFNKQNNKIFILTTKNTFLGLIKILQGLFGKSYINLYDKYLAFNYKKFIPHMTEIMQTFYLDACDTLIILGIDDPFAEKFEELLDIIFEIFEHKPRKKVIFVINSNIEETLIQKLKEKNLLNSCIREKDPKSSLCDLAEESKKKILSLNVEFQGKKVRFRRLIGADEDLHQLVRGDVIENIIEGKDIQIGGKFFTTSNSETNFAYIDKNINFETLMYEFKESDDIFVFKGLKEKCELICHFEELISKGLIEHQAISNQIQIIDPQCYEINNKRLILCNEMSTESFKELCHCNCRKKIYLIAVEKNGEESRFKLQELYNPNFYLRRKFKILIDQDQLKKMISEFESETFILSKNWSLDKSLEESFPNNKILTPVEAKSTFDACVKKNQLVHWFHKENWYNHWWTHKIYFKNSSGFCSDSGLDFRELKTDDEFLLAEQDVINYAINKKIIIIADNPGMGKSTTLTNLYESPVIADNHWIIRLNLKEHIISIKKINSKALNVDTVIHFLQLIEPNFKNELTQALFKSAMSVDGTLPITVLFAFDGFDEILDAGIRTTIISLLKYLKNITRSKIWITTRLHYKNILENELKTFAFQFEPIDEQHKRIYLQTYLQDRLKLIFERERANYIFELKNNSKIHIYTVKFLKHMKHIFTENVSPFIGTPLQLYLMTENSVEHFKNWIDQSTPDPDFSYLGNNILKVFENFIDRKYEIYYKKQNILEDVVRKKERENADEYHKALAESLIQSKPLSKMHENGSLLAFLIGLIQSHDGKHVEFIHYTFREYFVALSVIQNILIEPSDLEQKLKYLTNILEKAEFEVVRNFLDMSLESINFVEIPKDNIENFIKNFILPPTLIDGSYECRVSQSLERIFNRAWKEENRNIFGFMVYCCEFYLPESLCVDLIFSSASHVLSWTKYNNDGHIFKVLFKLVKRLPLESNRRIMYENITNFLYDSLNKNLMRIPSSQSTKSILNVARNNCQIKMVKTLLAKLNDIFSVDEYKQFFSTMNGGKLCEPVIHLVAKRNNIKLLLIFLSKGKEISSAKELLMNEDGSLKTVLHVATKYGSPALLNLLIREMNEILSTTELNQIIKKPDQYGSNVLYLAAERNNTEVMHLLLNVCRKLPSFKELLMNEDSSQKTVFHVAAECRSTNSLKELFREMNEVLSADEQKQIIMKHDQNGNNVLQLAATVNNSELINIWLNESKKLSSAKLLLMNEDNSLRTVLHEAIEHGSPDLLNLLIREMTEILSTNEYRQIIMTRDKKGNTVLHLCARFNTLEVMNMLLNGSKKLSAAKELFMNQNISLQTVFHLATERGYYALINLLIREMNEILSTTELRQIIMMRDKNGNTVLHLCASFNSLEVMDMLLNESKKLSAAKELFMNQNNSLQTVFHLAIERGSCALINLLNREMNELLSTNEQRQIIMKRDKNGNTVLHLCASFNSLEVMDMLFNESKKLSAAKELFMNQNNSLQTVFHLATEYRSPDLLKFFIKEMSEILSTNEQRQIIMMRDKNGNTVLDIAKRERNSASANLWMKKFKEILSPEEIEEMKNNTGENILNVCLSVIGRYFVKSLFNSQKPQ